MLGPLVVTRDGAAVKIGSRQQRALLIHLLLRAGQTVPVERLMDALWDEAPPPQARVTLRSYVSNLRRALQAPDDEELIVTRSNGYSIQIRPEALDSIRFERGVAAARTHTAAGAPRAALDELDDALQLWRGEALADLGDSPVATGERTRLEELRLSAHEDRFEALLALGRHAEAVASLEAFTAAEPLRERARGQLMLGLYRSGRAPDALKAFQRFRETLVEELGLDPSPQLQQLADRILNQADDLDAPEPPPSPPAGTTWPPQALAVGTSPLVGRVHERAELQAALSRLSDGDGGLLLLAGEPGIGKTALLEELARLATTGGELSVFWGRCHETGGAPPFWPWVQILRALASEQDDAELQSLAAGAAGAVSVLVDEIGQRAGEQRPVVGDDPEGARFQLYDAIATFLLRAAERRPLVLLLDDLHWADTASLQTVAFLTPSLSAAPILIAGTYRDVRADWAPDLEDTLATVVREPSTQQFGVTGLQPRDVGQLAERLTGEPLAPAELDLLYDRAGGNPFFVRQLSRLLHESEAGRAATGIPTGVRHVLARRMGQLPDAVREMLEMASVLGADFDVRRIAAAGGTPVGQVLDAAAEAVSHGLLDHAGRPTTGYRFVHALVRETLYDSIPPPRRARLHAQTAEALEALPQPPVAELAEHFWRGADVVGDDRPTRYLIAAADQALDVLGFEQAEEHMRRALELLAERGDDPTTEVQVRARLAQLLISTRGWAHPPIEGVIGSVRGLISRVGLRAEIVALWSSLIGFHTARGDDEAAAAVVQEMLEEGTAADDAAVLAAAHSAVAYLDVMRGREPANALVHVAEAYRHAGAAPPAQLRAPPHVGVQIIAFEAMALAMRGDRAAARTTARRAIAAADDIGDAFRQVHARTNAALVGALLEDAEFATQATTEGLMLCGRHGLRMATFVLTALDSWARARLGEDPGEHASRMWDALQATVAAGQGHPRAKYLLFTAETYLLAGDAAAAQRCLQETRAQASRLSETLDAERLARAEAHLAALTGDS